ncbi:hypothetical protein Tco_0534359, partial [Tanacetum coccineum]
VVRGSLPVRQKLLEDGLGPYVVSWALRCNLGKQVRIKVRYTLTKWYQSQIEDYLYQKKLHEPLAEAKPTSMKAEDWTLLNRRVVGVARSREMDISEVSLGFILSSGETFFSLKNSEDNSFNSPPDGVEGAKEEDICHAIQRISKT